MADVTIDSLPAVVAADLTGAEMAIISQALATKRISVADIKSFVLGAQGVYNFTVNVPPVLSDFDTNTMFVYRTAGLGSITITLPAAANKVNLPYRFILPAGLNAGDQFVLTAAAGDTIDAGLPSLTVAAGQKELISDGTQWYSR